LTGREERPGTLTCGAFSDGRMALSSANRPKSSDWRRSQTRRSCLAITCLGRRERRRFSSSGMVSPSQRAQGLSLRHPRPRLLPDKDEGSSCGGARATIAARSNPPGRDTRPMLLLLERSVFFGYSAYCCWMMPSGDFRWCVGEALLTAQAERRPRRWAPAVGRLPPPSVPPASRLRLRPGSGRRPFPADAAL
jgi:hypothetical protein